MGIVKQQMEDDEAKRRIAVDLLVKVGVLERCSVHEEICFQAYAGDVTDAYKLGNASWGTIGGAFKDRRDMTDTVLAESKSPDYGNDRCEICAKFLEDD